MPSPRDKRSKGLKKLESKFADQSVTRFERAVDDTIRAKDEEIERLKDHIDTLEDRIRALEPP